MEASEPEEVQPGAHWGKDDGLARLGALQATRPPPELAALLEGSGPLSGEVDAAARQVQDAEKFTDARRVPGGDQELLCRLRETGFAGPEYEIFADELARYALPVLRAWMYSGYIFVLAARRGHHLTPSDTELEQLRCDSALRDELTTMIIAKSLRFFRARVLIANTWLEDGGASVTTYFAGCCVFEFPNEFRLHRRTQKRWREQDLWETRTTSTTTAWADDPADVIGGKLWADSRLARLDPRPRAIVILRMSGYSYLEIAELLGETSVRAIEGVLYRLRTAERSWPTGEDER